MKIDFPIYNYVNQLIDFMSDEEKLKYQTLTRQLPLDQDGEYYFQTGNILLKAAYKQMQKNYPNNPICQWRMFLNKEPFLFFNDKAKEKGHIEATYQWCLWNETLDNWDILIKTHSMLVENHKYHPSAQRLGYLYKGDRVFNGPNFTSKKDLNKSLYWYEKAQELGAETTKEILSIKTQIKEKKEYPKKQIKKQTMPINKVQKILLDTPSYFKDCVKFAIKQKVFTLSMLLRKFQLGYIKTVSLIYTMHECGFIIQEEDNKYKTLITPTRFKKIFGKN